MKLPIVAIIGRPNVGKSSLFNRIIGRRHAIVDAKSGITRDRVYQEVEWDGKKFRLVDTGGIVIASEEKIAREVFYQVEKAIDESDIIIFLCDVKEGLHPLDQDIANLLRIRAKPVIISVNKVDNEKLEAEIYDFYQLGFGEPIAISALHGRGIDILLDNVIAILEEADFKNLATDQEQEIKVAIVGRPNVGKSSFLNALLGEKRVIVSEEPGTTRDSVDTHLIYRDKRITLIDTAGIRRKSKLKDDIQFYSILRAEKAIERCEICFCLIDGWQGLRRDDLRIIYYAWEKGKALALLVNKKDLIKIPLREYEKLLRARLPLADRIPLLYLSALTGENVKKALPLAVTLYENLSLRIKSSLLNETVWEKREEVRRLSSSKELKLYYIAQTGIKPPQFHIVVNKPDDISPEIERFLENIIRKRFGFLGSPLIFKFKERRRKK